MDDVKEAYKEMYRTMSAKQPDGLAAVLDDSFELVHMTGARMNKSEFIDAVMDGTLNYYEYHHDDIEVDMINDHIATLEGKTQVNAAVYGGGRHTWRLQQDCNLIQKNGRWLITKAVSSTY